MHSWGLATLEIYVNCGFWTWLSQIGKKIEAIISLRNVYTVEVQDFVYEVACLYSLLTTNLF